MDLKLVVNNEICGFFSYKEENLNSSIYGRFYIPFPNGNNINIENCFKYKVLETRKKSENQKYKYKILSPIFETMKTIEETLDSCDFIIYSINEIIEKNMYNNEPAEYTISLFIGANMITKIDHINDYSRIF